MKVGIPFFKTICALWHRSKIAGLLIVLMVVLTSHSVSFGQATSKRKVDYGHAVQEFINQGFPNVKGAEYVKVIDSNLKWRYDGFWFSNLSKMDKLTGNGFYIPHKDPSKSGRFVFFGGCDLHYVKNGQKQPADISRQLVTRGRISKADLKKDLATVQKWAATASADSDFKYYGTNNFSVAFGYANLAYQLGYKKEANELFKTLFLNHEEPERFIDHLINTLAEHESNIVYNTFKKSLDWKAYHAELLRLQDKYPRGWRNLPGLTILIPKVKQRIDNIAVNPPKIAGHTFSPEIQELIDATATPLKPSNSYYNRERLFLINKVEKNTKAPPFYQLTQHGMDGFIALVSLIGDNTLVSEMSNSESYSSGSSYYLGNNQSLSPEEAYRSMKKPPTRGAIAEDLVRSTMPHHSHKLQEIESAEIRRIATEWWKKHRNDSQTELIAHYLQQGNQSHLYALTQSLMEQDTKEAYLLLENSILSSENPSNFADSAKKYVKKRRSKAKDFIKKYHKALTAEIGDGKQDPPYRIRKAGGTEKFIASLMRYTADLNSAQMLAKLSRKKANVEDLMEALITAYAGKDMRKDINKFIYAAAKKKNLSEQLSIVSGLVEIMYVEPQANGRGAQDGAIQPMRSSALLGAVLGGITSGALVQEPTREEIQQPSKPYKIAFSKYQREDWEKLLFSNYDHIALSAGMVLDKLVNPSRKREEYLESHALGTIRRAKLVKERSRNLLEGKPIVALPSIKSVSKERQTEVSKLFIAAQPKDIRKTLLAFSLSEQLSLSRMSSNNGYNKKIAEASSFILGFAPLAPVYEIEEIEKLQGHLKQIIGLEIGAEAYYESAKILLTHMDEFAGLAVYLNTHSHLPGKNITIHEITKASDDKLDKAIEDTLAGKIEGFIYLSTYDSENKIEDSLIYRKGELPAKDQISAFLSGSNTNIAVFTKSSIEKTRKNRAANAKERKKVIEEILKIYPYAKDQIEPMNLKQLKQYRQIIQQNNTLNSF